MKTLHSATPEHDDVIQEPLEKSDGEGPITIPTGHFENFWVYFSGHEDVAVTGTSNRVRMHEDRRSEDLQRHKLKLLY